MCPTPCGCWHHLSQQFSAFGGSLPNGTARDAGRSAVRFHRCRPRPDGTGGDWNCVKMCQNDGRMMIVKIMGNHGNPQKENQGGFQIIMGNHGNHQKMTSRRHNREKISELNSSWPERSKVSAKRSTFPRSSIRRFLWKAAQSTVPHPTEVCFLSIPIPILCLHVDHIDRHTGLPSICQSVRKTSNGNHPVGCIDILQSAWGSSNMWLTRPHLLKSCFASSSCDFATDVAHQNDKECNEEMDRYGQYWHCAFRSKFPGLPRCAGDPQSLALCNVQICWNDWYSWGLTCVTGVLSILLLWKPRRWNRLNCRPRFHDPIWEDIFPEYPGPQSSQRDRWVLGWSGPPRQSSDPGNCERANSPPHTKTCWFSGWNLSTEITKTQNHSKSPSDDCLNLYQSAHVPIFLRSQIPSPAISCPCLHGGIRLPRAGWPHHHRQPGVHARADRLNLHRSETDRILPWPWGAAGVEGVVDGVSDVQQKKEQNWGVILETQLIYSTLRHVERCWKMFERS